MKLYQISYIHMYSTILEGIDTFLYLAIQSYGWQNDHREECMMERLVRDKSDFLTHSHSAFKTFLIYTFSSIQKLCCAMP